MPTQRDQHQHCLHGDMQICYECKIFYCRSCYKEWNYTERASTTLSHTVSGRDHYTTDIYPMPTPSTSRLGAWTAATTTSSVEDRLASYLYSPTPATSSASQLPASSVLNEGHIARAIDVLNERSISNN